MPQQLVSILTPTHNQQLLHSFKFFKPNVPGIWQVCSRYSSAVTPCSTGTNWTEFARIKPRVQPHLTIIDSAQLKGLYYI
jgi:hypothetical protein